MYDDRAVVQRRFERVLAERLRPAIHPRSVPLEVAVWHVPGEPVAVEEALRADYAPAAVGEPWGPPWSTTWFRLSGTVPQAWAGAAVEAVVDLGFDIDRPGFQCEGLVHTAEGVPI